MSFTPDDIMICVSTSCGTIELFSFEGQCISMFKPYHNIHPNKFITNIVCFANEDLIEIYLDDNKLKYRPIRINETEDALLIR